MRGIGGYLWAMRWSLAGFAGALAGSVLSFGTTSYLLYVVAAPVVTLFFPPLDAWRGPWVWPVLLATGFVWAPSFLVARAVDLRLERRAPRSLLRPLAYLGLLWAGAVLAWLLVLHLNMPR